MTDRSKTSSISAYKALLSATFTDFTSQHDQWCLKHKPQMKILTPYDINTRYEQLQSIVGTDLVEKDQNQHVDANNMRDYNKIVEQMHQDAYQDSQKNKLARLDKIAV